MSRQLMQVYEIPVYHFQPAVSWLHAQKINYFTRFGWKACLIQVMGTTQEQQEFMRLLGDLWITRATSVFPRKHRKLVEEELSSWGISYTRKRNPFVFEIETEIDDRELTRFLAAIRSLTKKPKRDKHMKKLVKSGVPDDISSLLD